MKYMLITTHLLKQKQIDDSSLNVRDKRLLYSYESNQNN